jgi:hypothetical protein
MEKGDWGREKRMMELLKDYGRSSNKLIVADVV